MGIWFGNEAQWSYSGFDRFRYRLHEQMRNERKITDVKSLIKAIKVWATEYYCGLKIDPLYILLGLSDCGGRFLPKECKALAPRLRQMVEGWDNNDYDKIQALVLVRAMEQYYANGEELFYG